VVDAKALVAEKAKDYGHPLDYSVVMREMWETLLASPHRNFHGTEEEPSDYDRAVEHCLYMVIGKVIRVWHNPTHLDSLQDIAGYANCLEECLDRVQSAPKSEVRHPDTITYTIELRGQHFLVTAAEMEVYRKLVNDGASPEAAAEAVYNRIVRDAGNAMVR